MNKWFWLLIGLFFTQVCAAYTCEERISFMYLFKVQSLITQKIDGKDSLKESITFCQNELSSYKDEVKKFMKDCEAGKIETSSVLADDQLIEEMYREDRGTIMVEEKKFAHSMVDKFQKNLDILKLCRDYGKDSPYIQSKLVK